MRTTNILIILLIATGLWSCNAMQDRQFETTESGLEYVFHVETGGEKAPLESILSMEMVYSVDDSVLFDSREAGMPMYLQLIESEFPGDIYEAFAMMAEGDSASFRVDAQDFFLRTAGMMEMPPFIEPGSLITFDVSLNKAMDEEGFAREQERLMEVQMQEDLARAEAEEGLMLAYLEEHHITIQPMESGLYYVEREAGEGPTVETGDLVAVHYEGRLLDGTVFDSSYEREEPLEFTVGHGQVISGWDEGIGMMREGGKATLVIPSYLAYGDRGAGQLIPPFSTLVFDVEVVEIR